MYNFGTNQLKFDYRYEWFFRFYSYYFSVLSVELMSDNILTIYIPGKWISHELVCFHELNVFFNLRLIFVMTTPEAIQESYIK